MVAGLLTLAATFWVDFGYLEGRQDGAHFTVLVAPWLVLQPWLRRVDLRPVPWFFLCLAFGWFAGPLLVGKVVNRLIGLPYRDWPVEYWHASRARRIPGRHEWTLVPASEAGPYHHPPGEQWLRAGWAVVMVATIPILTHDLEVPGWLALLWLGSLVVLSAGSYLQYRVDRRRLDRVVAQPDQAHDRQPGGEAREGEQ